MSSRRVCPAIVVASVLAVACATPPASAPAIESWSHAPGSLPPPATIPPTPVATPGPTAPAGAWTTVEHSGIVVTDARPTALVAGPDRFVAALAMGSGSGSAGTLAFASSLDGESWLPGTMDPAPFQGSALAIAHGSRWVAVGTQDPAPARAGRLVDICEREPLFNTGAAWWSDDGATWTLAGTDFGPGSLDAVTPYKGGFVAVAGENAGERGASTVWSSMDGTSWTRNADPAQASLARGAMYDLIATDSALLAVGQAECVDEGALAWRSTDGRAWEVIEIAPHGAASQVAQGPAGLLAVGWSGSDDAATYGGAWISEEGLAWQRADLPRNAGSVRDLQAIGGRYVIITEEGDIWSGADGRTWTKHFDQSSGVPSLVAGNTSVLVALGAMTCDCVGLDLPAWTAPAMILR